MEIREHKCDICERLYVTSKEVSGTITIDEPNGNRAMFSEVCQECTNEVMDKIGELAGLTKSK